MPRFTSSFRPVARQVAGRRFASTSTEAAQKKAQDALGGAQKTAEQVWASAKKFLGPVGEKAGNMLGCESSRFSSRISHIPCLHHVNLRPTSFSHGNVVLTVFPTAYRDPLIYNLNVTRELLKQVYLAERLQPPTSFSTIQSAYQTMWTRASNPAYWKDIAKTGELAKVGIYAVEAYGIFKVRLPFLTEDNPVSDVANS